MYDDWPTTNTPVTGKLTSSCDGCQPGHDVLSGPGREVLLSHVFTVRDRMVVLRGVGFKAFEGAKATLQMEVKSCGEQVFEDVCVNGEPYAIDASNNTLTVTGSGRYRIAIEGAEPGDVWVTQGATDTGNTMGLPTTGVPKT